MNSQGSKTAQEKNKKSTENKHKYIEICDINDREVKIAVLKIFNKMWENTDRQFNVLRKQINKHN